MSEKVDFVYIGKKSHKTPKKEFYAMKLSKKAKENLFPHWSEEQIKNTTIYYPKTDNIGGDNELFIRGLGWKKFGKTNKVTIPAFSGNIDDWDEYLEKYGKYCLFYSLSGYSLNDMDCGAYNERYEFLSLLQCKGGIVKYQKYVETIKAIQDIQREVFKEKLYFMTDVELRYFTNKNLFEPYFEDWLLVMPPYLDTPTDDLKMESFYVRCKRHENPKYSLLDFGKDDVFPICMADRMKMLFGEKCVELYQYILDNFSQLPTN